MRGRGEALHRSEKKCCKEKVKLTREEEVALYGEHRARYHMSLLDAHSLPKGELYQCANPDKMHYKELADRVSFFKKTKEGKDYD